VVEEGRLDIELCGTACRAAVLRGRCARR